MISVFIIQVMAWCPGLSLDILKKKSWTHMERRAHIIIEYIIHIFASIIKKHAYFADGMVLTQALVNNKQQANIWTNDVLLTTDQSDKSHSLSYIPPYTIQKCAHFCSEWCIGRYGTSALCDTWYCSVGPSGEIESSMWKTCEHVIRKCW